MATASTQPKSSDHPDADRAAAEIQAELAELRHDVAALSKSLGTFGKAKAEDLQHRAHEMSDEMLEESRRALRRIRKQVSDLERDLEVRVREHPLQWFLGAFGLGFLIALALRRSD